MRWPVVSALLAASLCLPSFAASAEGWAGFYSSPGSNKLSNNLPTSGYGQAENACLRAIFSAQQRYDIPDNLLLAIGLQEAGMARQNGLTVWPWSVNAEGESRQFGTRKAAIDWVQERQSMAVTSIDVGCMQVNLRWHPDVFATVAEGFDPVANVDYAARFLLSLKEQTGDWMEAAGAYHSFNPKPQAIYLQSLRQNLAVANNRLSYFDRLAKSTNTGPASNVQPPAEFAEVTVPTDGVFWSSWLSADKTQGQRSIYTNADLQPILPVFYKQF